MGQPVDRPSPELMILSLKNQHLEPVKNGRKSRLLVGTPSSLVDTGHRAWEMFSRFFAGYATLILSKKYQPLQTPQQNTATLGGN